jgi:hypothetical protein
MNMQMWNKEMTTTHKIFAGICAAAVIGVFVTITVYLGIYAYNNPDTGSCWVVKGLDAPQLTKDGAIAKSAQLGVSITEGYPVEMHHLFRAWFTWGFWSKIYLVVTSILFQSMNKCIGKTSSVLGAISCGLYLTNGLIWLIFGAIWRYSAAGKTAAGDNLERPDGLTDEVWENSMEKSRRDNGYQFASGTFMHIYVIAIASAVMICGAMTIVVTSIGCITAAGKAKD